MRLLSWVTLINVLISAGFAVASLVAPQSILPAGAVLTDATRIFAMYSAARTIPLALITVGAVCKQSADGLLALGILAGTMQFIDFIIIGFYQHDIGKAAGPLIVSIVQFYAVFAFLKANPKK
jgi:hypothetical protein